MSENDGYKHLNCVYDGLIMFCMLQFKYVYASLSNNIPVIGSSSCSRDGNFNVAESKILEYTLRSHLTKANDNLQNLHVNDDEYKNHRLKCEENDSCQLPIENIPQQLKDQEQSIKQQIPNLI